MGLTTTELPSPRNPRYASLDLWRGVACLVVVLHHSILYAPTYRTAHGQVTEATFGDPGAWAVSIAAHLWIGVPLFFVISGYCIAATADSVRRRPSPWRTYFLRRFRRIYPPYWIALILMLVLTGVIDTHVTPGLWTDSHVTFPRGEQLSGWQWLGNLTLTESWRPHLLGGPRGYLHALSWTLCYEEQFYLVIGLILVCARRYFFAAAVAITGLVLIAMHWLPSRGIAVDGFFFDGYWLPFAAGLLVYHTRNYASSHGRQIALGALMLSTVGTVVVAFESQSTHRLTHTSVPVATGIGLTFALALLVLERWDERLARLPILRPLVFCGEICYSLYLIHWPVVKGVAHGCERLGIESDLGVALVTMPLCVAASVFCSWAFHRMIERRFLNTPRVPRAGGGR